MYYYYYVAKSKMYIFFKEKTLNSQLNAVNKETLDLKAKLKNLKSDITSKNKQIKEYEKEVSYSYWYPKL